MVITQLVKLKHLLWFSDIDSKTLFQIIDSLNNALEALAINSSHPRHLLPLPLMPQQAKLTKNLPINDVSIARIKFQITQSKLFD